MGLPKQLSAPAPAAVAAVVPLLVALQVARSRRRRRARAAPKPALASIKATLDAATQEDVGSPSVWQEPAAGQAGALQVAEPYEIALLDLHLPLSAEQLWLAIMTQSKLMQDFWSMRRYHSMDIGHWRPQEGLLRKEQQYVLPLKKNPMGPREALAMDHLTCHHRSAAGFLVTAVSRTPHVPCGGSFQSQLQWTAVRTGAGQVHLRITGRTVFTGSCWIKGMVARFSREVRAWKQGWQVRQVLSHRHSTECHSRPCGCLALQQSVTALVLVQGMQEAFALMQDYLLRNADSLRCRSAEAGPVNGARAKQVQGQAPRRLLSLGGRLLLLLLSLFLLALWLHAAGRMLDGWQPQGRWHDPWLESVQQAHLQVAHWRQQSQAQVAVQAAVLKDLWHCTKQCMTPRQLPEDAGVNSTLP